MNFGIITQSPCINVVPPRDPRCDDPAFRLANPDICGGIGDLAPAFIIKPGIALRCKLDSVQFRAFTVENGTETDVTADTIFTTGDPSIALVGASSGNATGLSTGVVLIMATYKDKTSKAELNVLSCTRPGGDCGGPEGCTLNVAMMVLIDDTKSMSQGFSSTYTTKLDYAKEAARQFILSVNADKDVIGAMSFDILTQTLLSAPTSNIAAVAADVATVTQTQNLTAFHDGLAAAIEQLNLVTADLRVLILISDGEDTTEVYDDTNNPLQVSEAFQASGGVIICLGVRSHDQGYELLEALSTGGFFINGYGAVEQEAIDFVKGLKGYICAGNCTPNGDEIVYCGELDYDGFLNWDVIEGHVDLLGNGFFDFLPGNGLYVDMAGSTAEFKGKLQSKHTFDLTSGHTYRFALRVAGNQRVNQVPESLLAKVTGIARTITITGAGTVGANQTYSQIASGNNGTIFSGQTDPTWQIVWDAQFSIWRLYQGPDTYYVTSDDLFPGTWQNTPLNGWTFVVGSLPDPTGTQDFSESSDILSQQISVIDYTQGFLWYAFSFTAAADMVVRLSIQQIETPAGQDAIGLLLDHVQFTDQTDLIQLLDDNFDTENPHYIPPRCGTASTWYGGYAVGYDCYSEGCLDVPPVAQLPDPVSLPELEAPAGGGGGTTYSSTRTECASCPTGSGNTTENIIPVMTGATTPSGEASSDKPDSPGTEPWHAFTGIPGDNWQLWGQSGVYPCALRYSFDAPKTVAGYYIGAAWNTGDSPSKWLLQGSSDGTTWVTLDTKDFSLTGYVDPPNLVWVLSQVATYQHFRLYFTASQSGLDTISIRQFLLYGGIAPVQVCRTATRTSTDSQIKADQAASAAALAEAQDALNCAQIFTATEQYTATCPYGLFPVTRQATATSSISQADAISKALAQATLDANAALVCTGSTNTIAHQIPFTGAVNQTGPASPYPSVKVVSGAPVSITKVTVSLFGLTHTFPSDIRLALQSPAGTVVEFLRNAEQGAVNAPGVDLIFDDAAGSQLPAGLPNPPATGPMTSGTWKPSCFDDPPTEFQANYPAPGPVIPMPQTLATFAGEDANGKWYLWCWDSRTGDAGILAGGWDLTIT